MAAERRKQPTRRKGDKVEVENDRVVVKIVTAGDRAKAIGKLVTVVIGAMAIAFTAAIGAYRLVYFEWQAFQQEKAQREVAAKFEHSKGKE